MTRTLNLKFKKIRHFTADEFDAPDRIDDDALTLLDSMRHEEGLRNEIRIIVNADFAITGHSQGSRHGFGDAFDITILDRLTGNPLPIMTQFLMASRYSWGGIGIYPYWNRPGLHVDRRPWSVYKPRATWFRDENGNYSDIESYLRGLENEVIST